MARNGNTNVPNLLRNVPINKIHAPRGSARRFCLKLACLSFISIREIKNPPAFSGWVSKSGCLRYEDFISQPHGSAWLRTVMPGQQTMRSTSWLGHAEISHEERT